MKYKVGDKIRIVKTMTGCLGLSIVLYVEGN